jgi:hypothetical protein
VRPKSTCIVEVPAPTVVEGLPPRDRKSTTRENREMPGEILYPLRKLGTIRVETEWHVFPEQWPRRLTGRAPMKTRGVSIERGVWSRKQRGSPFPQRAAVFDMIPPVLSRPSQSQCRSAGPTMVCEPSGSPPVMRPAIVKGLLREPLRATQRQVRGYSSRSNSHQPRQQGGEA